MSQRERERERERERDHVGFTQTDLHETVTLHKFLTFNGRREKRNVIAKKKDNEIGKEAKGRRR